MTKPVSTTKKPRKQHSPEFRSEALKLAERVGVAAACMPALMPGAVKCNSGKPPVKPMYLSPAYSVVWNIYGHLARDRCPRSQILPVDVLN